MAYDIEEADIQANEIEREIVAVFQDYIYQIILCLDYFLELFDMAKIEIRFIINDPSDSDRPEEDKATPCDPMVVYKNQSIGQLPVPVCPGYDFVGWYTANEFGARVYDYQIADFNESTIVLYAKWTNGYVNVTLDPGSTGGVVYPTSIQVKYLEKFGYIPEPTNPNERFEYWYLETDFNPITPIDQNTIVENYFDFTISAQYEQQYWVLSYDINGGYGDAPVSEKYLPTQRIEHLAEGDKLNRPGYRFKGWSETRNSPVIIESGELMLWEDTTIYAVWEPISYDLEYVNTDNRNLTFVENMIYDEAYVLKSVNRLNIFNQEEKKNFEYWKFGNNILPDEEYVCNVCKVEGDKAKIFSIPSINSSNVYTCSVLTYVQGIPTSENVLVDTYIRSVYNGDTLTCLNTLDGVRINKEGFTFSSAKYVTSGGTEISLDPVNNVISRQILENGSMIKRYFSRRHFNLNYAIATDRTNFEEFVISTYDDVLFDADIQALSSTTLSCDPYQGLAYNKKFYYFPEWTPALPDGMPARDVQVCSKAVLSPGNLTIRYYFNNIQGYTTSYFTQTVPFMPHEEEDGIRYYGEATLECCVWTWDLHEFLGWDTNPEATQPKYPYSAETPPKIEIYNDTSLYAIWGPAHFNLNYVLSVYGENLKTEFTLRELYTNDYTLLNFSQLKMKDWNPGGIKKDKENIIVGYDVNLNDDDGVIQCYAGETIPLLKDVSLTGYVIAMGSGIYDSYFENAMNIQTTEDSLAEGSSTNIKFRINCSNAFPYAVHWNKIIENNKPDVWSMLEPSDFASHNFTRSELSSGEINVYTYRSSTVANTALSIDSFTGVKYIKNLTAGNKLDGIADSTFRGSSNLENLYLSSIRYLGKSSFRDCSKLEKVNFNTMREMTFMHYTTFLNSINLKFSCNVLPLNTSLYRLSSQTILYDSDPGTGSGYDYYRVVCSRKTGNFTTYIKNENDPKIRYIHPYALYNNDDLSSITLRADCVRIGANAFTGCVKVKEIDFYYQVLDKVSAYDSTCFGTSTENYVGSSISSNIRTGTYHYTADILDDSPFAWDGNTAKSSKNAALNTLIKKAGFTITKELHN